MHVNPRHHAVSPFRRVAFDAPFCLYAGLGSVGPTSSFQAFFLSVLDATFNGGRKLVHVNPRHHAVSPFRRVAFDAPFWLFAGLCSAGPTSSFQAFFL